MSRFAWADAGFLALLPWLTAWFAAALAVLQRAAPGEPHGRAAASGFVVVQLLLSALRDAMQQARSRGDAPGWCAAVDACARVLHEAQRQERCQAARRADVAACLEPQLQALLADTAALGSEHAAAAAGGMLRALLSVDVHLLEAELPRVWRILCAGHAHAPEDSVLAACDMVAAFGDTRMLPKLLLGATVGVCDGDAADARLLCAPRLAAAWAAAARKLPPMQAPELLQCVRSCVEHAREKGVLEPHADGARRLAPLAELLAATVAGITVTPEAQSALAQ